MSMFKKGSKAYSIFNFKCPKCQEGDLYKTKTLSFQKSFEMHDHCPSCRQDYCPEPGFYYGAMFISYILTGWFCLAVVGFCILVLGWSVNASFAALILICALLFVWVFRFSRSLWINIVVKYNPKAIKKPTT